MSRAAGFALELHTLMPLVRAGFNACSVGYRYCGLKTYVLPPALEVEKLWGKKTGVVRHSSAAFALCALKEPTSTTAKDDELQQQQQQQELSSSEESISETTDTAVEAPAPVATTGAMATTETATKAGRRRRVRKIA